MLLGSEPRRPSVESLGAMTKIEEVRPDESGDLLGGELAWSHNEPVSPIGEVVHCGGVDEVLELAPSGRRSTDFA